MEHLDALNARLSLSVTAIVGSAMGLFIFSVFLLTKAYKAGWRQAFTLQFYDDIPVKAALSLCVLMIGLLISSNWGLFYLYAQKHDANFIAIENQYPIALVGGAIRTLGMLCIIRVFSPIRWKYWPWLITLVVAVVLAIVVVTVDHRLTVAP